MVVGMVLATALTGCQNFFVCSKASCTNNGGGSGGSTINFAYVGNNVSDSTNINGYTLGKTTLAATTGSPYGVTNIPSALVVSHANGFLYMASAVTSSSLQAGIFGFTIGTGGALARLNNGTDFVALPLGSLGVAAMDVSADGQWLIVASKYDSINGATIQAYSLNATTGAVTVPSSAPVATSYGSGVGAPVVPVVSAVKIAPSGQYISVALGTGGVITFPFNATTGVISKGSIVPFTPNGTAGGYDVAIDSNNLLYVAATGGIFVFQVDLTSTTPTVTPLSGTGIATGPTGPWSIALDGTSYVYAGATSSAGANLIYAFSNSSGALTAISSVPTIAAPATTTKIAVDSTGAYLMADGFDTTAGLKLYSITAATGVLTSLDTAPTGVATGANVNAPVALALTH